MDQALKLKLKQYKKALVTFEEVIKKDYLKDLFIRDAAVQRFEYSFEISWKSAKLFLREKYGIDVYSSKEVFRELHKNKLLNASETESLLRMVNDRNITTHTSNEDFIKKLTHRLLKYFKLMKKIYDRISD